MTQHTITAHEVRIREDSEVDCFSSMTGLHYLPNETGKDTWIVSGFYYYHHLIKRLRIPIASSEDSERRSCFV